MRSGLRRRPERVEISARLGRLGTVKGGLALDCSQPILMVADSGDEFILPHPRLNRLRPVHRKTPPS